MRSHALDSGAHLDKRAADLFVLSAGTLHFVQPREEVKVVGEQTQVRCEVAKLVFVQQS